jgi:mannan endo-1,4-beta-mannosidase
MTEPQIAPPARPPGRSEMRHGRRSQRRRHRRLLTVCLSVLAAAVIAAGLVAYNRSNTKGGPLPAHLPAATGSYLGVYTKNLPASYTGVTSFKTTTGTTPDVVMYYSGWYVPFPTQFATTVATEGAAPLVQMNPSGINISKIAAGHYDGYLSAYAEAVRAYRHPVILSFGHEMNGDWYSWGYQHTSPAAFVAAWRHVVSLFRALGANNVTWLWTVNIINNTQKGTIPRPNAWWPGNSYVNWVGVDGYYLKPNWQFAPLFGPTIGDVRSFTSAPILIAETGAEPAAGQSAKIADLFAGVKAYGLLGFVYFDTTNSIGQPFGLSSAAAIAAYRKGASTYHRPNS